VLDKNTMTQTNSIGASSANPTTYGGGGAPSSTALQARLERYQKQLSDCVNCASAKTPEGKADIENISAQISQVKQRIAQADNTNPVPAAAASTTPVTATAASPGIGIGSSINVFA
jgi:hypothetical protein